MAICPPNMRKCDLKKKCLYGPNEGDAYDPKGPCDCIPNSLFDDNNCDCITRGGYYRWRKRAVRVAGALVNYDTSCVVQSVNQDSGLTFTGTPVNGYSGLVDSFEFAVFKYEDAGACGFPNASNQYFRTMYITKTVDGVEEFLDLSQIPAGQFNCCFGIGPQLFTVRLQVWYNETQAPDPNNDDELIFDNLNDYEAGQVSPDTPDNAPYSLWLDELDPAL